jgi:hydrogenase nickel incorporation protein HypB
MSVVTIERKVLASNDAVASGNRERLRRHGVLALNIVSSPGAGKTSLIEKTIAALRDRVRIAVIEGDVQTDLDARRVARCGVPAVQIVTNGACHLDAPLVAAALDQIDLAALDLLVIENVGNLVCPAAYDLGEALKVVVSSTAEGDDKPLKYPAMFRRAAVLVVNKTDLLPYVDCDVAAIRERALAINPSLVTFEVSCRTLDGIARWCDWLEGRVRQADA